MKFKVISDLHLEFRDNGKYKISEAEDDKDIVLLLAGDIGLAEANDYIRNERLKSFIKDCSERFKKVIYILGNHEHYHSSIDESCDILKRKFKEYKNVYILQNEFAIVRDVKKKFIIIGSTLWTDMGRGNSIVMNNAQQYMNDYKHIMEGCVGDYIDLRPQRTYEEHNKSLSYIMETIQNHENKDDYEYHYIVLTHHLPSYLSVDPIFKESILNPMFASELYDVIINLKPILWVHGHTHSSCDYKIGKTRVICNPRGYPNESKIDFNDRMIIEL